MSSLGVPHYNEDPDIFVEQFIDWFTTNSRDRYAEAVSQLEHAEQVADLARDGGASDSEIVASLLHDVGHVLMRRQRLDGAGDEHDLRHEQIGANWLVKSFGTLVSEPVRLHVPAKRYLCAVDSDYWNSLSNGSRRSLVLQGGPMPKHECREIGRAHV